MLSTALLLWIGSAAALAPGDFDVSFGSAGKVVQQLGIGPVPDTEPEGVALQPDGKIVVVGNASDAVGNNAVLAARYNPNGSLDSSFGTGGKVLTQSGATVTAMALAPDGKIVVGGNHRDLNGHVAFFLARLNSNGSLDNSFGSGGVVFTQVGASANKYSDVLAVAVQPDGKVLAGGWATQSTGEGVFMVARLTSKGDFDLSFGTNGLQVAPVDAGAPADSGVEALALNPDGTILAAGQAKDTNTTYGLVVVRLRSDGSLDSSFGTGAKVLTQLGAGTTPSTNGTSLARQPDGKILVGGEASIGGGRTQAFVARLNPGGTFDSSFGSGGKMLTQLGTGPAPDSRVTALALQPNGKVVVGGGGIDNGKFMFAVARLQPSGALDPSFGTGGKVVTQLGSGGNPASSVRGVALEPDGKLVTAGSTSYGTAGNSQALVTRLIADLSPSPTFTASHPAATGRPVSFDGTASTDSDGTITSYTWDFGDGSTGSGSKATHVYGRPGSYTVRLTIKDDYGLTAAETQPIVVKTAPALKGLRVRPRAFRSKGRKRGAAITYRDTLASVTTFVVERIKGRRHVKVGTLRHRDHPGSNRFHFGAHLRGHALKPGSYRLKATPRAGGLSGRTVSVRFRVIR